MADEKEELIKRIRLLQQVRAAKNEKLQAVTADKSGVPKESVPKPTLAETTSTFDKFKHGMAKGVVETALGAKDLVTDLTDTEKETLRQMRSDAEEMGGWSTAGDITGEMMQMALPAGRLNKAIKAKRAGGGLMGMPMVGGALGLLSDVALGAGFSALQAPEDGQTRAEAAEQGGVGTLIGAGLGRTMEKLFKGIKQSQAGEYLTDLGVKLTPGQAAEGGLPKAAEYSLSLFPFTAKSTLRAQDRAAKSFNEKMLELAGPPGAKITKAGHEGMQQLKDAYSAAYADAWEKAGKLSDDDIVKLIGMNEVFRRTSADAATPSRKVREALEKYIDEPSTKKLDRLDDMFRSEIQRLENAQAPNFELIDSLSQMRDTLRGGVSQETQDALNQINKQYGKFKTVQTAASTLSSMKAGDDLDGGIFGGDELMSAAKRVGGLDRASRGVAPLQTEAKAATSTLSRKDPMPLMSHVRGVAKQVHIPGTGALFLDPAANALMGRTPPQKIGQYLINTLRNQGFTGSTAGAAASDDPWGEILRSYGVGG